MTQNISSAKRRIYRYSCPTEGCEIMTIEVALYPDLVEDFGMCCPFCQAHLIKVPNRSRVLDQALNEGDTGRLIEGISQFCQRSLKRMDEKKAGRRS